MEYFIFTEPELAVALGRPALPAQVYCTLQMGYFKAKQLFFRFPWDKLPKEDIAFILDRYFAGQDFFRFPVTKHEFYAQRTAIVSFFGYRPWCQEFLPQLEQLAAQVVSRDITPNFIVAELIAFLKEQKIVRPGYTTLQTVIGDVLTTERNRLGHILNEMLDERTETALKKLLVREDTLSGLAAIKQEAKHFGHRMMVAERQKRVTLEPLYQAASSILPRLAVSKQNLNHYASLAHYYTIYDLRRLKPEQTSLYLLCYAWQRYQELTDNLAEALGYHMKQFEDETKEKAKKQFSEYQAKREQESPRVGRLLLFYVDESLNDDVPFGEIRQRAFSVMPKESVRKTGQQLCENPANEMAFRWQAVDQVAGRCRKQLRPLCMTLDFSSATPECPWLAAIRWFREVFSRQQKLTQRPLSECPPETIPKRLRPHLLVLDKDGTAIALRADRYEFWVYRQIRKRLGSGELYLNDSIQHRSFTAELVPLDDKGNLLQQLNIPWLRQPVDLTLDELVGELHLLWRDFNDELRQGKLKHLEYDSTNKTLAWYKPKADHSEELQSRFYSKLPYCDIADVFGFVNERCRVLSALTPLQPRYAKKIADDDSLLAVIVAQAMNHGNLKMAETSDIPYHVLEATHQQYLRLSTLQAANDLISNEIARLSIFPYYAFDLEILYGSVDGQKYEVADPTIKARHSRKYFGRGKGVVAYTLLSNHVPLQSQLIGANEHESHYVFDICYNNTSDIMPIAITGDMHSINKANFAILHWFGLKLEPRFTNLQTQLNHLYCGPGLSEYENWLIQPVGEIDCRLIVEEKSNIDQVVATLGLKEMTQSTLIKKLCSFTQDNRTRKAIFEFDKLVRSIYTLRYLRDPQLQRNVHRSQNRIESYHQLRSAIAQVGGKKELTGKTNLDIEISNQCGRLIANAIIYYNSAILSHLLDKYQVANNREILAFVKMISPVAWQHIHFLGHYTFCGNKRPIDLDAIVANLALGVDK